MMDLIRKAAFEGQCGRCSTEHACGAYRQCMNKPVPMVKAHPASDLLKAELAERAERLERIKRLDDPEAGR